MYEEEADVSLVTGGTRRLGLGDMDPSQGQLVAQETALAEYPSAGEFHLFLAAKLHNVYCVILPCGVTTVTTWLQD